MVCFNHILSLETFFLTFEVLMRYAFLVLTIGGNRLYIEVVEFFSQFVCSPQSQDLRLTVANDSLPHCKNYHNQYLGCTKFCRCLQNITLYPHCYLLGLNRRNVSVSNSIYVSKTFWRIVITSNRLWILSIAFRACHMFCMFIIILNIRFKIWSCFY